MQINYRVNECNPNVIAMLQMFRRSGAESIDHIIEDAMHETGKKVHEMR